MLERKMFMASGSIPPETTGKRQSAVLRQCRREKVQLKMVWEKITNYFYKGHKESIRKFPGNPEARGIVIPINSKILNATGNSLEGGSDSNNVKVINPQTIRKLI